MTLCSRLSRLEATHLQSATSIEIVADDEADFDDQFERALLSVPSIGKITVSGSIAGVPFTETLERVSHEEALERLQ